MTPKHRALWFVLLAFLLGMAAGGGSVYLIVTNTAKPPESTGTTMINATSYYWTNVTPPITRLFQPCCQALNVSFEGVHFRVSIYETMECNVLNVTGAEVGGPTYSFLIYPIPYNCQNWRPLVLSPDGVFGAVWYRTTTVTLLVRAS